eukprot:COSAG06_NODE_26250_length_618_cov_2.662813_1_plen_147_part_10
MEPSGGCLALTSTLESRELEGARMVTLSPVGAKLCTRSGPRGRLWLQLPLLSRENYAEENEAAVEVMSLVIRTVDAAGMSDAELARLTATSRKLRNLVDRSDTWTLRYHMRVANLQEHTTYIDSSGSPMRTVMRVAAPAPEPEPQQQ